MSALRPHLDAVLRRRYGVTDPDVLRLLARAVAAAADGHAALDLAVATAAGRDRAEGREPDGHDPDGDGGAEPPLPDLAAARRLLAACAAVRVVDPVAGPDAVTADAAPTDGPRPFVLEGDLLATDREHRAERRVLAALARRAGVAAPVPVPDRIAADAAEQRAAVATLLTAGRTHGVGVLVGGPGTGKTTTVAALVAAELAAARADGRELRVALVAPTGRAAARMREAVHGRAGAVAAVHGPEVAADLAALEARTVHALLGLRPPRTRRTDPDPVAADLVVVDEASMLPLPVAATLVEALRPDARLVLVGDPDQLASVETGAVLASLVAGLGAGPVARLVENHRDAGAAADRAALVAAIRTGDAEAAVAALAAAGPDGRAGLIWIRTGAGGGDAAAVAAALAPVLDGGPEGGGSAGGLRAVRDAALAGDAAAALAALRDVRVVCGHREGPHGVRVWAEAVRARLALADAPGAAADGPVPGEPVQLTRSERSGPLRNGDVGVVVGRGGTRRIAFDVDDPARPGTPLERATTAVGPLETALAVTVHKSQGAEHGTVVVVLPPADSPLATRELLYTAVTRARHRAIVVGTEEAVAACVRSPSVRGGGLARGAAAWAAHVGSAPASRDAG